MSQKKRRQRFSREFKEKAVKRMLRGESPSALSMELRVLRKDLYLWKSAYVKGEPLTNRPGPRPKNPVVAGKDADAAWRRVAELERKVGQQELELDFFAKALQCIEQVQLRKSAESSIRSSTRRHRKAN
jgi:transposase